MCNKLELIYSSFFSTIGSVLYHASTKNPRLWQLSESAWYKAEHQHKSPSHRDFSRTTLQTPALSDWTSFRKRNTISFWEIAACSYCPLSRVLPVTLANRQEFGFEFHLRSSPSYSEYRDISQPADYFISLFTPCWRDPIRSKQLSTVAIAGFQFGFSILSLSR